MEVRLITTGHYKNFDADDVDLSIRYGFRQDWTNHECVELFGEQAFAICSPAFLAAHPELGGSVAAMKQAPLLYASQRGIQF